MSSNIHATRRPGRPQKDDDSKKRHRLQVAMTDSEVENARQLAQLNGTSLSGAVVEAVNARLKYHMAGLEAEVQRLRETNHTLKLQNVNLRSIVLLTRLLCRSLLVEDEHSKHNNGRPLLDSELRHSIELALRETSEIAV